jgi:hypothetical protein
VQSVGSALWRWAQMSSRDPKNTYVWICSLCLNQHRIGTTSIVSPDELANEFGPRVQSIGRQSAAYARAVAQAAVPRARMMLV